jgi:glycosyltransferase involved in cell wall biosynthesis
MRLAERLQAGTFDNTLCALEVSGDNHATSPDGVPLVSLNNGRRGGRLPGDPATALRLRKLLRAERPAIIVGHGASTLKYTALCKLLRPSARTVYINIGMASHWASSPVKLRLNRTLLRRVDKIVSVSQTSRQDFQRHYSVKEEKTVYIPNGTDVSRFSVATDLSVRRAARAAMGLGDSAFAMLTVGSLTEEKCQAVLVPVLAELRKQGLDARLLIAGAGPLRGAIEAAADGLGVRPALHMLGSVSDVPQVMSAADVFVLPSRTEGMPGVLIEAGIAGLPAVAFNVGGVGEVISDGVTGYLVRPGDAVGLTSEISRLARDSALRAAVGSAASARCRDLFDMRKVASEYEQLFIALSAGRQSRRSARESRQSG